MANEKELNPSPKYPDGTYPELSPNPNIHDGLVNKTQEKADTQVVNEGHKQELPSYVTREEAIKIAREYGGDKSKPSFQVNDIKALTDEECNSLEVGNSVDKKTGNQHHIYVVTYKEKNQGLCLTYFDATTIETVSYDYSGGHWVYNSTDKLESAIADAISQSLLNGSLKTAFQAKTFSVSEFPLQSDIDTQHSTVNAGLLPNGDMSGLTESQIDKIVLTLNRIIDKGWLKVGTLRALRIASVMYDSSIISIAANSSVYNASGIVSGTSYLITLDIANSSYSYAAATYTPTI